MAAKTTVCLLAVEPEVGRFLTADERVAAEELSLPVREVGRGPLDIDSVLSDANAFAAFVLEGLLLHRLQIGEQSALRLLGPGDVVSLSANGPSLLAESRYTSAAPTRLAMCGNEVLVAAHRWPRIVAGLHVLAAEQNGRLEMQLGICQLPRVEDRLLAVMWLLAESWGTVTSHGTRLPLALTHDALGGLIGASRPTVTLALRELAERGAMVRQSGGWLLLEGPPEPSVSPKTTAEPVLLEDDGPDWTAGHDPPAAGMTDHDELMATVGTLREKHRRSTKRFQERLTAMRSAREQAARRRRRIARLGVSRRRAPSS
jgi:CRP/FNR family transcriptional regulator, cyclic AMP receptor protein